MSATGSSAKDPGSTRHREHNQGNQGRDVTPEQEAAVLRIRACTATAFYDILGLESVRKTCTESDIKKAYRKQSLLTHPDKNGHEHADEAFKMVSRAFSVLSDKDKRDRYDRFGGDPDSRFGQQQAQSGFSGFANRAGGGGDGFAQQGNPFGEEITPEELFRQFFGGGFGGGGGGFGGGMPFGGFDTGPQFMFNFGGPGVRVHQFGGRPQRRAAPNAPPGRTGPNNPPSNLLQTIFSLLPIIVFFILPILSNLLSGWSTPTTPTTPRMVFDAPIPPLTVRREMTRFGVPYFVEPSVVDGWTGQKLKELDRVAEGVFVKALRAECAGEQGRREQLLYDAQGWFFDDAEKMEAARNYAMPSCGRLRSLGLSR